MIRATTQIDVMRDDELLVEGRLQHVLTVRDSVSAGTVAKLAERAGGAAATADDLWRRRAELLLRGTSRNC